MALKITAAEYAEKWGRRTAAATPDVTRGVDRVTESPGVKAAAAQETMVTKLLQSIQDGTWAAQLRKLSLEDWKRLMKDKGIQRIQSGITAAMPGQQAMAEKLFSAIEATLSEVNQTKRGDLESNIARSVAMQRGMAKRKLRRPGA